MYTRNNPLRYVDPTGKDFWTKIGNFLEYGIWGEEEDVKKSEDLKRDWLREQNFYRQAPDGTWYSLNPDQMDRRAVFYWYHTYQLAIAEGRLVDLTPEQQAAANILPAITTAPPGSSTPRNNVTSKIKDNARLQKEAQAATRNQAVQRDVDNLTEQLANGNMNPGIGNKSLFNGIIEARGANGGRVYFRNVGGNIEILAKSSKANQARVIEELRKVYGK